ncbi:MAG: glycoside hydrolase family 9 protein [Anaerolineae bacterium]
MVAFWTLNEQEYLEAPGVSVLVFHNSYPEGKQGGLEIIQHGERVASCGDVRLGVMPGQWDSLPQVGKREVDIGTRTVRVLGHFEGQDIRYTVSVQPEGETLRISVDLDRPLPPAWVGRVGFNLEIYPGAYFGKTFHLDAAHEVFPRQSNGPMTIDEEGHKAPLPLATGRRFVAAPEDQLRRLTIESLTGELRLYDGRDQAQNGWFVVREDLSANTTRGAVIWIVRPNLVPSWRRAPVIAVSQAGYHPDQEKRAVIELDPRTETPAPVTLQRFDPDEAAKGAVDAYSAAPEPWGRWLYYRYAIFDFTEVREPGLYRVRYGDEMSPPFPIGPQVYRQNVWQPTLETFFPVQMCHMRVQDCYRVWHGACHLDDALQAPTNHQHFDGYRQHEETDTPYAPYAHIPHLDRGGWHDAGDYDLAAGSQARTTHTLALIRELFDIDLDQTTVDQEERLVLLHTPDGVPDIIEQVAHGVENLLGGYRAVGHSFHGIIASSLEQYVHLGDASTMTDNRIYDSDLALAETEVTPEGIFSGDMDDRWVFTNHDTALEYMVIAALAAAARVLREHMPDLAEECLSTAVEAFAFEQEHEPVEQRGGYVPRGPKVQEVMAASELLLTTGERVYRERLMALWPTVEAHIGWVGGAVARALPEIDDAEFAAKFREAVAAGGEEFEATLADNPFGIVFQPRVWGIGWQLLSYAVQLYQLRLAVPDLIDREIILRVVNYVLGCHPASSTSLASGVGAASSTVAYGVNRADWSYIPGGVPSGPALIRPDLMEYKEPWPFLWQQTEYVMSGAANFIFCVLAADKMLNEA